VLYLLGLGEKMTQVLFFSSVAYDLLNGNFCIYKMEKLYYKEIQGRGNYLYYYLLSHTFSHYFFETHLSNTHILDKTSLSLFIYLNVNP